jgi:hypothetical protein
VAPPHDPDPVLSQGASETQCLRIMQDRHIALSDPVQQCDRVLCQHRFVVVRFTPTQSAVVPARPVQPIVEPLRYTEEGLVTLYHDPVIVDADPVRVPDDAVQHLCDATPGSRRTDIPHARPVEGSSCTARGTNELVRTLCPDQTKEALGRRACHPDLTRLDHLSIMP